MTAAILQYLECESKCRIHSKGPRLLMSAKLLVRSSSPWLLISLSGMSIACFPGGRTNLLLQLDFLPR